MLVKDIDVTQVWALFEGLPCELPFGYDAPKQATVWYYSNLSRPFLDVGIDDPVMALAVLDSVAKNAVMYRSDYLNAILESLGTEFDPFINVDYLRDGTDSRNDSGEQDTATLETFAGATTGTSKTDWNTDENRKHDGHEVQTLDGTEQAGNLRTLDTHKDQKTDDTTHNVTDVDSSGNTSTSQVAYDTQDMKQTVSVSSRDETDTTFDGKLMGSVVTVDTGTITDAGNKKTDNEQETATDDTTVTNSSGKNTGETKGDTNSKTSGNVNQTHNDRSEGEHEETIRGMQGMNYDVALASIYNTRLISWNLALNKIISEAILLSHWSI